MSPASHNRLFSGGSVVVVWTLAAAVWPTAELRQEKLYLLIATFGYGHLIGAAAIRRVAARARNAGPAGWTTMSFTAISIATGFCAYSWLLGSAPLAIVPFALASIWHTLENDRQLGAAYRTPRRLPPLPTRPRDHYWFAPAAAATLGLAVCTHEVRAALSLEPLPWQPHMIDVYGIPALYHLFSWLKLSLDRARAGDGRGRARLRRELLVVHAVPIAIAPLALASDGAQAALLQQALYSPQIYLYWSFLHVIQTVVLRGRRPRGESPQSDSFPIPSPSLGPAEGARYEPPPNQPDRTRNRHAARLHAEPARLSPDQRANRDRAGRRRV